MIFGKIVLVINADAYQLNHKEKLLVQLKKYKFFLVLFQENMFKYIVCYEQPYLFRIHDIKWSIFPHEWIPKWWPY